MGADGLDAGIFDAHISPEIYPKLKCRFFRFRKILDVNNFAESDIHFLKIFVSNNHKFLGGEGGSRPIIRSGVPAFPPAKQRYFFLGGGGVESTQGI